MMTAMEIWKLVSGISRRKVRVGAYVDDDFRTRPIARVGLAPRELPPRAVERVAGEKHDVEVRGCGSSARCVRYGGLREKYRHRVVVGLPLATPQKVGDSRVAVLGS